MTTVLISTGGTIACTTDASGALVPTKTAADLAALLDEPVRAVDYIQLDSSAVTLADLDGLIAMVMETAADPTVERIIVTHGTDSLEETAMALSLFYDSLTPVVLTGAQRPFDAAEPDGPRNLNDALHAEGCGVLIQFGGMTTPAWGARKEHTQSLRAFGAAEADVPSVLPLPRHPLADQKVTVLAAYPGAPGDLVDAAVAAGYRGLVVEGMGSGNVSPGMGAALARAFSAGVQVVLTTRVTNGPVSLIYGGEGGGATLAAKGAVGSGVLHAGQARIVLAAALATGTDVRELFS